MSYTISLYRRDIHTVFHMPSGPESSPDDGMRASLAQALLQYPDLKNLKISDDAKLARAKIIFKLEQAQQNDGKDYLKFYSGDDVKQLFLQNLADTIQFLKYRTDFSPVMSSYLGDGKTDRIKPFGAAPKMSYRTFLMRFTQDTHLLVRAIGPSIESGSRTVEQNPEVLKQKSRLERLLRSLEAKHPEKEYKNTFFQAHLALINLDTEQGIRNAMEILNGNTKGLIGIKNLIDEFNLDFDKYIGTDAAFGKALRDIGDTQSAGEEMLKVFETGLKDWKNSNIPSRKSLYEKFYTPDGKPKSAPATYIQQSADKYAQMLASTNQRDPERAILIAQEKQIIAGSAQMMFLDATVTGHIRQYGDKDLNTVLKTFNDMKGIHGLGNLSDENVKMTKEIGLMIGSMVLTAGASSLLAGAAVVARTSALAVRGAQAANTTTRTARVGQALRAAGAAPLNAAATTLKGASSGLRWLEGTKASFLIEGVKFTTVHASLQSYFREEGEKSGFNNFLGQLATNTVMFGTFQGMEKFITGPVAAKIVAKLGIKDAKVAAFAVNNLTYSVGDVAVMQALHAAETGKLELLDTKALFEALAYRVAFGMGPQGLSKLKEKFPKQTAKFESTYGSIQSPKAWMEKLKKKNPTIAEGIPQGSFHTGDEMAHGARLEPVGNRVSPPSRRAESLKNTEFLQLKGLDITTLPRGTTLSFTHPGSTVHSAGEVVLKMLGNGQARVVSLPKGDRQGTMDYGLKNGDTIDVSLSSDAQHQFLNLRHLKNGTTSLIMNDVSTIRFQKPTRHSVASNKSDENPELNHFREQKNKEPLRIENDITPNNVKKPQEFITDFKGLNVGDSVKVLYNGKIVDGTVQKISANHDSVNIKIGENTLISGPADKVRILRPTESGQITPNNPKNEFSTQRYAYQIEFGPNGERIVRVKSIGDKEFRRIGEDGGTNIDMPKNHFDARLDLEFSKLEASTRVNPATPDTPTLPNARPKLVRSPDPVKDPAGNSTPDAIAKQRADIVRAEKHLASLEQSRRELTPLRQSRREVQEHLRSERQKLIEMTPESRAAELARIQAEGKELIGRKGDLEKKLETEKDKITWDERRAIEKDIEEIGKKIDANRRQENMVKRADVIATKLRDNGIDPTAAADAIKDPQKRKGLADSLDKLKSNDKAKWAAVLLLLLLLGSWLFSSSGDAHDEVSGPTLDPSAPSGLQLDAVCGEQSKVEKPKLVFIRRNEGGMQLTEKVRENISGRYIQTREWKSVVDEFQKNKALYQGSGFANAFEAMMKKPSTEAVQRIQQWIGMQSIDNKQGQDGILGPITTQALTGFIRKCLQDSVVPSAPPKASSGASGDEAGSFMTDAMGNPTGP